MIIEGEFIVPVPQDKVWDFLQDIRQVSACVPGAEAVEEVGPDTYRGRLRVQVGAIRGTFSGEITIVEQEPPTRLVAKVKGEDPRLASIVDATFEGCLEPNGEHTRLIYRVDLHLRGRIAQFGRGVIQLTANRMAEEFAHCLERTLQGERAGAS